MAKMIKFDLPIDGVKVATLDDLRDHFTTEIVGHFRSGTLARWLQSRGMARELAGVEGLMAGDDTAMLKELCRIFEVEADDAAIAAALMEATGVPGIRPDQVPRKQTRNPGDMFRDCPECPVLVVVPAGNFMMGSPEWEQGRDDNESPLHEVRIDHPLAVGVYPVTFNEWDACVCEGGCEGYRPRGKRWGRGNRPVIKVTWRDAQGYVRWLTSKTGKGYRLLSESEWEYVARAGTTTRFWWGDEDGEIRNNCVSELERKMSPMGSFSANGFGLHDVLGNVWEWVEDCWHDNYHGAPADGSAWESGDSDRRILRGGDWESGSWHQRSATRAWHPEWLQDPTREYIGFRVARTLD